LARMAEYQLLDGAVDEALGLAQRACQVAEQVETPMEQRYRQRDRALLLQTAGRPGEALALTVPESEAPLPFQVDTSLLRVELLLDMGRAAAAHDGVL